MSISLEDIEYRQWQLRHIREEDKEDLIKWLFDGNLQKLLFSFKGIKDKEEEIEKLEKEIGSIEDENFDLETEVQELESEIVRLKKEIEKLKSKEK